MKHHVIIDDRSKAGKGLMQIVEELLKTSKGIEIFDEEKEDKAFGSMMKKAKTGKNVSREMIMKKLK